MKKILTKIIDRIWNIEYRIWNMGLSYSKFNLQNSIFNSRGFVIPFSLMISTIILTISLGVSFILVKEISFSKINRDSLLAYYSADEALYCAKYLDTWYRDTTQPTPPNLFPLNSDTLNATLGIYGLNKDNVTCDGSTLGDLSITGCSGSGCITTYRMTMDLGGSTRCANVTVDNSTSPKYKATGYSNCSTSNTVERTVTSN